jgi:hypothetical protein
MAQVLKTQQEARRILRLAVREPAEPAADDAIDRVVLHPLWGMLLLAATMFLMFQAVFSWAACPWRPSTAPRRWASGCMPGCPMARCAACWSMALWPAWAGCWCFCRRS